MSKKYTFGIGTRLVEIRGNLTQSEFAELHGATRAQVVNYENEISEPGLEYLTSISVLSGYALEWIVSGEGEKLVQNRFKNFLKNASKEHLSVRDSEFIYGKTQLRIVGTVPAGLGEITDRSDWHEWLPVDFNPEKDVVLEVSKENGESMIPFINVGDYAIITDSIKVKAGDLVAALWTKHAGAIKVYDEQNGNTILLSYNPIHTPIILPKSKVKLYFVKSIIKRRR